jgi:uncharacterized protein (TIGR03437 family)
VPAEVQYAGLAPAVAGVYQVNFRVPEGVPIGDEIPVSIQVTNAEGAPVASNTVTMAIEAIQ